MITRLMAVLIIVVRNLKHCQVCAPLGDGCDGCYLISRAPRRWDQREGWHAEILPGLGGAKADGPIAEMPCCFWKSEICLKRSRRMDSWHSILNKITLVHMIECMIGAFLQAEKSLAGRTMTLVALQLALQVSFGSIDVLLSFHTKWLLHSVRLYLVCAVHNFGFGCEFPK